MDREPPLHNWQQGHLCLKAIPVARPTQPPEEAVQPCHLVTPGLPIRFLEGGVGHEALQIEARGRQFVRNLGTQDGDRVATLAHGETLLHEPPCVPP